MPLYTTEALVLRTYKLKEADRIVVFLTRDRGKKRGVAQGARRMRSRFGGALEPLTRVGVAYFESEHRELVSLNYAETITSPLWAVKAESLGYASYFAELIDEWAPEGDPNESLFRLGASVVDALGGRAPADALARYFEFWLLRLQGVYPPFKVCQACGRRLVREGEGGAVLVPGEHAFRCRACAGGEDRPRALSLSADALAFIGSAVAVRPAALDGLVVSRDALEELERVHRTLIGMHLEKELKSARVLREMHHAE